MANIWMSGEIKHCKFSALGMVELKKSKHKNSIGVIVGETVNGRCYKIIWPGAKTSNSYHKSFIELLHSETAVQGSDTTEAQSSEEAGNIKK